MCVCIYIYLYTYIYVSIPMPLWNPAGAVGAGWRRRGARVAPPSRGGLFLMIEVPLY